MSKLRIAVIGAGRLGGFHAQKLAERPDVELTAVVDPFAPHRHRVAAECDCEASAEHRCLRGRIDAAVIATPTVAHYSLAKELLEDGVHLLVEKPLCHDSEDADALVDLARRRQRVLQVGHVERFNPAFCAAAQQIAAPKYIEAVRAGGFTFRSTDVGVVLDLMIHDIDLVLSLVKSRARRIDALGLSVLGGREDVANARITFDCGCVATLSASRVSYENTRRMNLWSLEGFASVDFAARTTTLIRPSQTLKNREFDVDQLSPERTEYYRQHFAEEHLPREMLQFEAVDAIALELQDFVEAIRTGRQPRVSGEMGRDAVTLAEEILDRIQTHNWDSTLEGPVGPLAVHRRHIIPAPHFRYTADEEVERREAG
ncbi:MAG: Gfo/Idh/MocA family oxidoreductase [Pirellulales bacterium]|nr:Gfo/Idh/MocA family oxidoreductase [Pirellulales bacterium]